jgi:hypothetical protein
LVNVSDIKNDIVVENINDDSFLLLDDKIDETDLYGMLSEFFG